MNKSTNERDRRPYVGEGADGARRSAQIDREELELLDRLDPRRDELTASADEWDRQATRHEQRESAR